jgi:hypothetical protein
VRGAEADFYIKLAPTSNKSKTHKKATLRISKKAHQHTKAKLNPLHLLEALGHIFGIEFLV